MTVKLKYISAALFLVSSGTGMIHANAVLTVNGMKVEKTVSILTFDGDEVKVIFSNDCSSRFDMGDISFSFVPDAGIDAIHSFHILSMTVGDKLEISGVANGCMLQVYDLNGVLSVQSISYGETCVMDISHLKEGAYILKAGKEIVKFIKH